MMELHQSGRFPIEGLCTYYPVEKFEEAVGDVLKGRVSNIDGGLFRLLLTVVPDVEGHH